VVFAAALVGLALSAAGCSSSSGGSGSDTGTGLQAALSRIADTASNRSQITYDDTAELVALAGSNPGSTKGFAGLRGWGVSAVVVDTETLPGNAGFNLFGEQYGISAGTPPATLSLMAGGQSAAQITSHLASLGWRRSGGRLVGPSLAAASSVAGPLALNMAQVLPAGADVVFGGSAANLSQIGSPHGATLASDPAISALAQCLGNVVAAGIFSGGYLGGAGPAAGPTAVAVGISRPSSNAATPHAVVCVSWSSQAASATYASELPRAFSGVSVAQDVPYSTLLTHPTVTDVGGGQHVVEWQADTPQSALTVFSLVDDMGLPALPDCAKLSPAAAASLVGCH
jgi:hypothetical protein